MRARRLFTVVVVAGAIAGARGATLAQAQPVPLGGRCLTMAGAGHAVCRPRAAASPAGTEARAVAPPAPRAATIGFADFAATYSLYRLVSATDPHRGCRLQPTCSLFAAQAARRLGWWRGLLMGLARAQMAHDDQGGLLPSVVAADGDFIYLDPVERWIRGQP